MNSPPEGARPSSFVLASASAYRATVLRRAGFQFDQVPANVDERAHDSIFGESGPAALAEHLAVLKAQDVFRRGTSEDAFQASALRRTRSQYLVVGADQVGARLDLATGSVEQLHKPTTLVEAVEHVWRWSGSEAHLYNGVCAIVGDGGGSDRLAVRSDRHCIRFRTFERAMAERYVATFEPLDSLGGIRIEDCLPGSEWDFIEDFDWGSIDAIMGMPIALLNEVVAELDVAIPTELPNQRPL